MDPEGEPPEPGEQGIGEVRRFRGRPTVLGAVVAAVRRTGNIVVDRPRAAAWTLIALTATLFAVGVAGVGADNLDTWTRAPRGRASVVVYLAGSVDAAHGAVLAETLARLRWVDRAEYVPAAETARRLEAALGFDATSAPHIAADGRATQPQLLDGVDLASLPATVELTLVPGVRDVVAMSPTARALRDTPGVDDVVVEDGGEDRVAATLAAVRLVAWSGGALLVGLALVVALAVVRVQLDRGPRELALARLLGAGPGYVAVPSALAGMLLGTIAALAAGALVFAAVAAYGGSVAATLAPTLGAIEVAPPGLGEVALFVAVGAALGLLGGGLAGVTRASR